MDSMLPTGLVRLRQERRKHTSLLRTWRPHKIYPVIYTNDSDPLCP